MSVTNYFQIGNLSVPSSWIAFIVASILAYIVVRVRFGKLHSERVADALFTVLLVWKLSVIVTDFESVLRSPLAIIYFDGGAVGFYLGLVFMAGKVFWDRKKNRLPGAAIHALLTGAILVQVVYQMMMILLNDGEWIAQVVTVLFFGVFLLFFWLDSRNVKDLRSSVWLFMAVHLFVATLQPKGLLGTAVGVTLFLGLLFIMLYSKGSQTGPGLEEQT